MFSKTYWYSPQNLLNIFRTSFSSRTSKKAIFSFPDKIPDCRFKGGFFNKLLAVSWLL